MLQVPSYEEFEVLKQQVADLQRTVQQLLGQELAYFTVDQTAEALKCSVSTVHRLRKEGKLTPHYRGSKPLYAVNQVRAYIESRHVSTEAANERILIASRSSPKYLRRFSNP